MAKQMQTSRAQLDRLLDPEKTGVSIETITLSSDRSGSPVENRISLSEIIQLIKKEASRRPIQKLPLLIQLNLLKVYQ